MGWTMRARRGLRPMATPTGMVHSGGDEKRRIDAAGRLRRRLRSSSFKSGQVIVLSMTTACKAPQPTTATRPQPRGDQNQTELRVGFSSSSGWTTRHSFVRARRRKIGSSMLVQTRPGSELRRLERRSRARIGRADAVGGLDLLEFEFVAPGDEWAPDKLIGGDDDEDDGRRCRGQSARSRRCRWRSEDSCRGREAGSCDRPMVNISQAMRANHPPATETMEFQTRPMAA